jgi:hypothetical protein
MSVTTADAKAYLKVQGSAEDTLIGQLVTRATAMVRSALGRPLALADRSFTERAESRRLYHAVTAILIPPQYLPCTREDGSDLTAPVITDADGLVLSATEDYYPGEIWDATILARPGITFTNGPYSVEVQCGLEADPDYADVIEPAIDSAIMDTIADLYQRRSPNASSESTGGGVSTSYHQSGIPMRAWQMIESWAVIRA